LKKRCRSNVIAVKWNRRDFLKQSGIAGSGLVLGCSCLCGCSNSQTGIEKEISEMEPNISKCGYRCDLCPAHESNLKSDADKKRMCDAWAKYLGSNIEPEVITACEGCQKGGGEPDCAVRKCSEERNLENCAHCDDFGCEKLKSKMDFVEHKVKNPESIPKEDYNRFIEPFFGRKHLLEIRKSLKN
jgi:hypothetical protein